MNTDMQINNDQNKNGIELPAALNEYQVTREFKELQQQVSKLETTCHAYWIMLQKRGFTNEEFDEAMAQALNYEKRNDYVLKGLRCPACGKNAQLSGFFKLKCIYCGSEAIIHPYEMDEMLKMNDAEQAEAQRQREEQQMLDSGAQYFDPNMQFEPYDVTKDLNFDEDQ